jgi:hypothetical protein
MMIHLQTNLAKDRFYRIIFKSKLIEIYMPNLKHFHKEYFCLILPQVVFQFNSILFPISFGAYSKKMFIKTSFFHYENRIATYINVNGFIMGVIWKLY